MLGKKSYGKWIPLIIAQEKERAPNRKFANLKKLVFASFLKGEAIGCKHTGIPKPFFEKLHCDLPNFRDKYEATLQ